MSLSETELALLKDVVSLPTAPFCESHVQEYIWSWAEQADIIFQQDASGNILLTYPGKGRQPVNPWVLQAHMDHPGFTVINQRGKTVHAWFRGGVAERYFPDARVRFFPTAGTPVGGMVQTARRGYESLLTDTVQRAPNAALQKVIKKWLIDNYIKCAPLL